MSEAGRRFRATMAAPGITVLPGVFNGFSARLVQDAGYAAAAISGAGISESLLGWADRGILTFDQNLNACRLLAECVDIPLLADADTGYGNALTVSFVVRAFEKAGLAAISIEDQVWPKRCGHMLSADDIRTVAPSVPKPLAVNMGFGLIERGTIPLLTPRPLQDLGVSTVSYPRMLTSAALQGMRNALDAFQPTITADRPTLRPHLQTPFGEINRLMGMNQLEALEARYADDPR